MPMNLMLVGDLILDEPNPDAFSLIAHERRWPKPMWWWVT